MPAKKSPTQTITRDAKGLITKPKINYIFTDEGAINWHKMIKKEHLVPNKDKTKETDISKLEDNKLLILLQGIKELAQVRGYTDVRYEVTSPSPDYVVAVCSIKWIPNYETESKEVVFSAIGDASPRNTSNFAKHFLGPIAENRAFVRCVRSFLKIGIVGNDEVSDQVPTENTADPSKLLEEVMKEKNVTFESVKKRLVEEGFNKAETFSSVRDIPKSKVFELIERLKKVKR